MIKISHADSDFIFALVNTGSPMKGLVRTGTNGKAVKKLTSLLFELIKCIFFLQWTAIRFVSPGQEGYKKETYKDQAVACLCLLVERKNAAALYRLLHQLNDKEETGKYHIVLSQITKGNP